MMTPFRLEAGFAGALYRLPPCGRPGDLPAHWNLHRITGRRGCSSMVEL